MAYTLRVSVLEACQLRCGYCLPNGFTKLNKNGDRLSLDQYEIIARGLTNLPIEKIRFTGGEPLLRADLPSIVEIFREVSSRLAVTTNGLRFSSMQDALIKAGITQITFHLDTLRSGRYHAAMGHGDIRVVLDAIDLAKSAGLRVKLNVVIQRGLNDDEIMDFLFFAQKKQVEARFIEMMNTGAARAYVKKTFISGKEILALIEHCTPIHRLGRPYKSSPAELFMASDLKLAFGLIASDTEPFCGDCNRLRLSADGSLRGCLYEPVGQKLTLMNDKDLQVDLRRIVAEKTSFHPLVKKDRKNFSMSQVGG